MPRPNHGPGGGHNYDKARDFKGAIKRLFSELNIYKTLIIIAFTLAILGSVLSILAPNRLSDLTDEISAGLVINSDNMTVLNKKASENLSEDKLKELLPEILSPNISEDNISNIMRDSSISQEDKEGVISKISEEYPDISAMEMYSMSVDVRNGDTVQTVFLSVPYSLEGLENYFTFRGRTSHKSFALDDGGARLRHRVDPTGGARRGPRGGRGGSLRRADRQRR